MNLMLGHDTTDDSYFVYEEGDDKAPILIGTYKECLVFIISELMTVADNQGE